MNIYEAIDVQNEGLIWLPFANGMLRKLKDFLVNTGQIYGRREGFTPDGSRVEVRTRLEGDDWYDYIRIEGGESYFVFAPFVKKRINSTSYPLANTHTSVIVPFGYNGNSALLSLNPAPVTARVIELPHSAPGGRQVVTGFNSNAPDTSDFGSTHDQFVRFAYVDQELINIFNFGAGTDIRGVFRHRYTDTATGQEVTKLLAVTDTGVIRDAETGATLTSGGAALSGTSPCTWGASKDGRKVVLHFSKTVISSAAKRFLLDIDFASTVQQVTRTDITSSIDNTGFILSNVVAINDWDINGSGSSVSIGSSSFTGQGILCSGVKSSGESVSIDVGTTSGHSASVNTQYSGGNSCVTVGFLTGAALWAIRQLVNRKITSTESRSEESKLVITMPSGFSVEFTTANKIESVNESGDIDGYIWFYEISGSSQCYWHAQDGDWDRNRVTEQLEDQGFRVIYADPSIPILFYEWARVAISERHTQHTLYTGLASEADPLGTASYDSSSELARTEAYTLDVGVITDTDHTIITRKEYVNVQNTVTPSSGTVTVSAGSQNGGVSPPGVLLFADEVTNTNTPSTVSDSSIQTQLRRTRDLGFTGVKYVVSAKNKRDWILGASKFSSPLGGGALEQALDITSSFDVWAGRIDRTKLRQKFLEYCAEGLQGSQPAVAADLLANALTAYEVKLGYDQTGSYI